MHAAPVKEDCGDEGSDAASAPPQSGITPTLPYTKRSLYAALAERKVKRSPFARYRPVMDLAEHPHLRRPQVDPSRLTYHLLRPRDSDPADALILAEAYRCWIEVWQQTFYELEHVLRVPSDEFTRQDEIGALFHGWECIGLTFYRWIDLANPFHKDDSYFAIWPQDAVEAAAAFGSRLCICSNLTVSAPWRRARGGPLAELLGALAIERFLKSDGDTLVGTPREDRGINQLSYKLGARALAHGIMHHGVKVDLIAFYRKSCIRVPLAPDVETILRILLP